MLTGIEIPYLLTLLYPFLNYVGPLKKDIEKDVKYDEEEINGLTLESYKSEYNPPMYLNTGQPGIGLPIGGTITIDLRKLYSQTNSKKYSYQNYQQVEESLPPDIYTKQHSYINTSDELNTMLKKYNISQTKFPISLPLKATEFCYKTGAHTHPYGAIAYNRHTLMAFVRWEKRLPGTLTIPITATILLGLSWFHYALERNYYSPYHRPYYPPFHPKRIESYFKITQ